MHKPALSWLNVEIENPEMCGWPGNAVLK